MADVGVVMPVYYQKSEYLQQAIQSLLDQTYTAFRFVIVIDGAPEMLELVQSFVRDDPRVETLMNKTNLGVAGALNEGFARLLGDSRLRYLTWVSSDNIYSPAYLEIFRRTLRQSPNEVGLVYSSFRSINEEGTCIKTEGELALLRQFQSQPIDQILDSSLIGVSFMYKKEYALKIGGYRYAPIEDYDFWLRLTEVCDVRYIPVELMDYRVDSEYSVSFTLKSQERHRLWRSMYHLARREARERRGIPAETSVLFLAGKDLDRDEALIEEMYEQLYSNYEVYVLDLSPDYSAYHRISSIPHPSVQYKWFPMANELEALFYAAQFLETRFTFVYRNVGFLNHVELHFLAQELRTKPSSALSVFMSPDRSQIHRRCDQFQELPLGNELFKTGKLVEWLILHRTKLAGGNG